METEQSVPMGIITGACMPLANWRPFSVRGQLSDMSCEGQALGISTAFVSSSSAIPALITSNNTGLLQDCILDWSPAVEGRPQKHGSHRRGLHWARDGVCVGPSWGKDHCH